MSRRLVRGFVFFVATLCVVMVALWYFAFKNESQAPVLLALRTAMVSPGVMKALGGATIEKRYVTGHVISGPDYGNADLTIHVAGPNGEGTLFEWAQNGFGGWHICSLKYRGSTGAEITVLSDAATHCDRE